MASASLLTLIDDIAAMLDDIAILSKVAAKKTAGVLGDDLALNAQQVSGVNADRELPVVWAVTKGSLLNKLILVPAALTISTLAPWLINYLLILGGLFLVFEGVEKLLHNFLHTKEELTQAHDKKVSALLDKNINIVEAEKDKIKGAIRTDFVLSAEIIVIILGTVQSSTMETQIMVLTLMAILFTVIVYGAVALIVKLDDMGLYFLRKSVSGNFNRLQRLIGRALLKFAPFLMKILSIVGTAAVFLVGGGILVHAIPFLHQFVEQTVDAVTILPAITNIVSSLSAALLNSLIGLIVGLIVLLAVTILKKVKMAL
ncbi:MAG: DUF808 domain-containing protein [Litorilituus sp.]|jgi:hypothetical protein|nr:DUF808 domain-containing protein [Litorilituus sp.]